MENDRHKTLGLTAVCAFLFFCCASLALYEIQNILVRGDEGVASGLLFGFAIWVGYNTMAATGKYWVLYHSKSSTPAEKAS